VNALPDILAEDLGTVAPSVLRAAYHRLSVSYRSSQGSGVIASDVDALAYAAGRLPATLAVATRVLADLAEALPGLSPRSVLDLGAGPGTAGWAAAATFGSLQCVTFVERSREMIGLGERLARRSDRRVLREARWQQGDARRPATAASVVIASYVLGELPEKDRRGAVECWWAAAQECLVVVEPGTPQGWQRVLEARHTAEALGAHVAGPCPVAPGCALSESNWCHFATRVARTRLHRQIKSGGLGFEDEKYSYVTLTRTPVTASPRVAGVPAVHGGHVRVRICGGEGVAERVVSKRDGEAHKWARHARWGDRVPPFVDAQRTLQADDRPPGAPA
jgi:ribosomal protein RSM22 (predicted rRNA methylase)